MGKRDALLRKNAPVVNEAASDNIIDTLVEDMNGLTPSEVNESQKTNKTIEEETSVKEKPKSSKKNEEKPQINPNFKFANKKTQKKTIHKSFTISEELNKKYAALAASTGQNENELFTSILEQIFDTGE